MSRGGVPSAIASSSLRRARADERVVHVALVVANLALHTLDGLFGGVPLPTPALPRRTTNAYRMANRYDRSEVEHEWHDATAKLETPVELKFDSYALDMVSRATVVAKLAQAGVPMATALGAVGMGE